MLSRDWLLQGLEFELIVYTPYRSMDGFIYDLEVVPISCTCMALYEKLLEFIIISLKNFRIMWAELHILSGAAGQSYHAYNCV